MPPAGSGARGDDWTAATPERPQDAAQLEAARKAVPRDPDAAQALGTTLARLYVAELEGLHGQALEDRRRNLEATLRSPALARRTPWRPAPVSGCLRPSPFAPPPGP